MMDAKNLNSIIETYRKHGWSLRRVLLLEVTRAAVEEALMFAGADVRGAEIDAMWFSRRSRPDTTAWELRAMSASPFAILEMVPDSMPESDLEEVLRSAESQMADRLIGARGAENGGAN